MQICRFAKKADLQKSRFAEKQICRKADLQKSRFAEKHADLQKSRFAERQFYSFVGKQICRKADWLIGSQICRIAEKQICRKADQFANLQKSSFAERHADMQKSRLKGRYVVRLGRYAGKELRFAENRSYAFSVQCNN